MRTHLEFDRMENAHGEVAEWLKAHAWKACVPAMVPQVRILFSPPIYKYVHLDVFIYCAEYVFEPAVLLQSKSRKVRRSAVKKNVFTYFSSKRRKL